MQFARAVQRSFPATISSLDFFKASATHGLRSALWTSAMRSRVSTATPAFGMRTMMGCARSSVFTGPMPEAGGR